MILMYIFFFILGTVLASFINATLYRIDNEYKYPEILVKGSHCEKCKHDLSWIDLIPVLGFVINRGRCRYCKIPINTYYPISELLLGLSFLAVYAYSLPSYTYVIILFLFILCFYDIKEMAIPQNITHVFLVFCILIFVFNFQLSNIYFPLAIAAFLFLLNLFKKSFGIGDILVILGLGILISWKQAIVFFWLSIIIALLYSLGYIALTNTELKKAKIPMVPFLSIAYIVSLMYGDTVFWYIIKLLQL